eukprot:s374_g29.t1
MSITVLLDLRQETPLGYYLEDTEEIEKSKNHLSAAVKLLELQVELAKCRSEEAQNDEYGAKLQRLAHDVLDSREPGCLSSNPHWPIWAAGMRDLILNQTARRQKVCVACNGPVEEQGVIEQELAILCDIAAPPEAKQLWIVYSDSSGTQTLSFAIEDEVLNCTAGLIAEFAQELLRRPRVEVFGLRIAFYPSRKELKHDIATSETISQAMNQQRVTPEVFVLEVQEGEGVAIDIA